MVTAKYFFTFFLLEMWKCGNVEAVEQEEKLCNEEETVRDF